MSHHVYPQRIHTLTSLYAPRAGVADADQPGHLPRPLSPQSPSSISTSSRSPPPPSSSVHLAKAKDGFSLPRSATFQTDEGVGVTAVYPDGGVYTPHSTRTHHHHRHHLVSAEEEFSHSQPVPSTSFRNNDGGDNTNSNSLPGAYSLPHTVPHRLTRAASWTGGLYADQYEQQLRYSRQPQPQPHQQQQQLFPYTPPVRYKHGGRVRHGTTSRLLSDASHSSFIHRASSSSSSLSSSSSSTVSSLVPNTGFGRRSLVRQPQSTAMMSPIERYHSIHGTFARAESSPSPEEVELLAREAAKREAKAKAAFMEKRKCDALAFLSKATSDCMENEDRPDDVETAPVARLDISEGEEEEEPRNMLGVFRATKVRVFRATQVRVRDGKDADAPTIRQRANQCALKLSRHIKEAAATGIWAQYMGDLLDENDSAGETDSEWSGDDDDDDGDDTRTRETGAVCGVRGKHSTVAAPGTVQGDVEAALYMGVAKRAVSPPRKSFFSDANPPPRHNFTPLLTPEVVISCHRNSKIKEMQNRPPRSVEEEQDAITQNKLAFANTHHEDLLKLKLPMGSDGTAGKENVVHWNTMTAYRQRSLAIMNRSSWGRKTVSLSLVESLKKPCKQEPGKIPAATLLSQHPTHLKKEKAEEDEEEGEEPPQPKRTKRSVAVG